MLVSFFASLISLAGYLALHPEVLDRQFRSGVTVINQNTMVEDNVTYILVFDDRTKALLADIRQRRSIQCGGFNVTETIFGTPVLNQHIDPCLGLHNYQGEYQSSNYLWFMGTFGVYVGSIGVAARDKLRERLISSNGNRGRVECSCGAYFLRHSH